MNTDMGRPAAMSPMVGNASDRACETPGHRSMRFRVRRHTVSGRQRWYAVRPATVKPEAGGTASQLDREEGACGSDIAKDVLVSGDAAAGMIYNGFSAKARAEGANVEYAYPKEGFVVWMDNVVLLEDAPNRANALEFMDFLLEPENIAAVTNYARYAAGVKGVTDLLDADLKSAPESVPPADAPPGTFIAVCDQKTQEVYVAIWTRLKK